MPDRIDYNFIAAHKLAAFVPHAARPMLAGSAHEPQVIPVDVRVHLNCGEPLFPAKPIPSSKLAPQSRPVGTLLDCYV